MDLSNINKATEWFEVFQTSKRSQTAMMTLAPGQATGESRGAQEERPGSARVVRQGRPNPVRLSKGDVLLIPAGTVHRFNNSGKKAAVTFNVYSPPEYPPGTKG